MNKFLIAIAFASLLSACAEAPRRTALVEAVPTSSAAVVMEEDSMENEAAFNGPGAGTAAMLGFHGPVERVVARSTN